jgi:outer membrane protein TolC
MMIFTLFFIFSSPSLQALTHTADIIQLTESYKQSSPKVEEEKQKFLQASAKEQETKAALFPELVLRGSYQTRDSKNLRLIRNPEQLTMAINLTYRLFESGKDYFLKRRDEELKEVQVFRSAEWHQQQASQIIESYFQYQGLSWQKATQQELMTLLNELERYMASRVAQGRSRESEKWQIEAQKKVALQQDEELQRQLGVPLQNLGAIFPLATPLKVHTLNLETVKWSKKDHLTLEQLNPEQALLKHPTWKRLLKQKDSLSQQYRSRLADHGPKISLTANKYLKQTNQIAGETNWDVAVRMDVPIFSGGRIFATQDQDQAQSRVIDTQMQGFKLEYREALRQWTNALNSLREQFTALKSSYDIQQKIYRQARKDYELGLINNLEVLRILSELLESKKRLGQQYFITLSAEHQLELIRQEHPLLAILQELSR